MFFFTSAADGDFFKGAAAFLESTTAADGDLFFFTPEAAAAGDGDFFTFFTPEAAAAVERDFFT